MRRGTLVGLALLVGVLAWLHFREEGELAGGAGPPERSELLVGFSPERVSVVRIDNLERAVQVKLERDSAGAWFLTDPVAYPATDSLVRSLLSTLARGTGEPDAEVELADVSLDPPKAVVEVVQDDPDGPRTFRMEVGGVDLDGSRIYVRVADHPDPAVAGAGGVMRATRTIYTTLDRNPDDYRERRATHLFGRDIVSFRRSGSAVVASPDGGGIAQVDLTFDATLEPDGWKKTNPPVVTLDPNAVGLLARGAAELEVDAFAADSPRSFEPWGLDPPAFSIALEDGRGGGTTLHFGYPTTYGPSLTLPEIWYCRRDGYPHVWEIDADDVALLTLPAENLVDTLLVRAHRQDIRRVELRRGGALVLLEREDDDWLVSARDAGGEDSATGDARRFPAELGRVQDVIALLEKSYLGDHLPGVDYVPADPPTSISIITRTGQRFGGDIGAPFRGSASGAAGPLFRRFGDEVCALVHEDVAALCELTLEDLRSRRIHRILETDLRWIRLEHDGRQLTYVQVEPTEWRPEGESIDAPRALTDSLATLLSLHAQRWLPPAAEPGDSSARLADVLEVVVLDAGEERRFRLGRTADGTPVYESGDLRAEVDFSQHVVTYGVDPIEALLSLFGG